MMRRIQWWKRMVGGIGVITVLLLGAAVESSFAQGQRFVVFEAFLRFT